MLSISSMRIILDWKNKDCCLMAPPMTELMASSFLSSEELSSIISELDWLAKAWMEEVLPQPKGP